MHKAKRWSIRTLLWVLTVSVFSGMILSMQESCSPASKENEADSNWVSKAQFVGSESCKSCHETAYNDWILSDHYKAMEIPNEKTVVANFSGTYTADGISSSFYKKGNKYYIQTQSETGSQKEYEVKYTFGFYPLQQYIIELENGKLQAARQSWDAKQKKWFHQYAGRNISHRDWLHWTGVSQNWNTMCASCHSTQVVKNYDASKDSYHTTFSEINVSCESCHGPGSMHNAQMQRSDYTQKKERGERLPLFIYKNDLQVNHVNACAKCHSRKTDLLEHQYAAGDLLNSSIPQLISDDNYYADGQIKEEDYEYGSFTQSKMYKHGIKCSNCHNPHSGKLIKAGNDMCLTCHAPKYNLPAHHFHKQGTEASQCISCHMPSKIYMGNDLRRDHSFRIPRPDQSVQYNTPNACNQCHTNKTASWATGNIVKWYGASRPYHFSDDLLPGSKRNEKSIAHLEKLSSDTSQPVIARATALYYLGDIQSAGAPQILLKYLSDPNSLIRYQAYRSLENFDPGFWANEVLKGFQDPVLAVRIAAADLYHRYAPKMDNENYKGAYENALNENLNYLKYQLDFAIGNVMLADYYLQEMDYMNAILYYNAGLRKDSLMNYARFNLATAYNSVSQNENAIRVLKEAVAIDPENGRSYFNLGLLYAEMGNLKEADNAFKKAIIKDYQDPSMYYNYGVLKLQQKAFTQALSIFKSGVGRYPREARLIYGLALTYMQRGDRKSAQPLVQELKAVAPQDPNYQELYKMFGL